MREFERARLCLGSRIHGSLFLIGTREVRYVFFNFSRGGRRISHDQERDGTIKSGVAGSLACRAKGIVEEREGVYATARPVKPAAPGNALGTSREGLRVRWPEGQGNARGPFRRPKPAH